MSDETPIPDEAPKPITMVPGWYPDPDGSRQERWWDGSDWTGTYRPVPNDGKLTTAPDGSPVSPSSRLIALLLAFFIGSFGIHSFYVGKNSIGVWQIVITVLSCGTLGWVWPLLDCVMLLVGSYRDSQNRLVLNWNT